MKNNINRDHYFKSIEQSLLELKQQSITLLDLKIIDASLKELRKTAQVFAPLHHIRKVTVFGSARARPKDAIYRMAKAFAKEISKKGYMVMTGAGPGVMQAAHEGAGTPKSIGLNIQLPFEQTANPIIQGDAKLVNFKYFFNRKLTMVKESDALVLFPGGYGTQDELFETLTLLQTGKTRPTPLIVMEPKQNTYWKSWKKFISQSLLKRGLISKEDLSFVLFSTDVKDAVNFISFFYKNYHSIRYYQNALLIRVWRIPSPKELSKISKKFKDIL
ncbi:MAG: TIGR00730 family Rossman fold protein, partial [Deltaproteobacteria bacterium]|nr:TIGR00730 family Rossman fold protein [Deltaproteobacteria bacterium]